MSNVTPFLTVAQVAQELAVSDSAVYLWVNQGLLRGTKLGRNKKSPIRVSRAALDEFITAGQLPAAANQ